MACDGVAFDTSRDWRGESASAALSADQIDAVCRALRNQRKTIEGLSLEHNLDRLVLKHRLGPTAWRDLPCYAGWFFTRIPGDGTAVPCGTCSLPLGNLREESLEEIWNDPQYRAFRRQASRPAGWADFARDCECGWCCYTRENFLIHRFATSARCTGKPWSKVGGQSSRTMSRRTSHCARQLLS